MSLEKMDSKEFASMGIRFKTEEETRAFGELIRRELEIRVGEELQRHITDEQGAEFDRISDVDVARVWLEANCPEFRDIVQNKINEFEDEIIRYRSMISGVLLESNKEEDKR